MQAISFFAGVGGIDLGFEKAGVSCVWANEMDAYAAQTYRLNFDNELVVGDIRSLDIDAIPNVDMLLAGFPCQAFSVAGYRKGFNDDRGNLFFDLMRVVEAKKPSVLFLENVKNLVGHDDGKTFKIILEALSANGYHIKHQVLNACDYGNIPQNRERIYIVAFLDFDAYQRFSFPEPVVLTTKLADVIGFNSKVDPKYYYTKESCKFYDILDAQMTRSDTVYQWRRVYVRENKSGVCPTLTANMGTGGHNVPLIKTRHGLRKLLPRECFNIQGYPSDYRLSDTMANSRQYKQAGNSVAVPVVAAIAHAIVDAVK